MKFLTYKEAEQLSFNWKKESGIQVIAFVDSTCENCKFFDDTILPVIEEHGIKTYGVDLRKNDVAFPPSSTPTLYWYFAEDMPPLVKKGAPPTRQILEEFLDKMNRVYLGEKTVEEEFF
jgi:hypothetical protein